MTDINKKILVTPTMNTGITLVQKTNKQTYLIRIVENIGKTNEPLEIGFIANCIIFVFDILFANPKYIDNGFQVLASNLSGVPVLIGAGSNNALGTSLFWAISGIADGKKNAMSLKNNESLILSIVGLHYALSLAEFELPKDSQVQTWVRDARQTLFQTNIGIRDELEKIYNPMKGTDLTRGTTIFALLGVFIDTCSSSDMKEIITKYNVLMKNAYIPFIKLK